MDIYVGNLPYSVTRDEVADLFAEHGHVRGVHLVTDRETGRSKGFAFVTMPDDSDARNAMEALNGASLGGRALRVNPAQGGGRPQRHGRRH